MRCPAHDRDKCRIRHSVDANDSGQIIGRVSCSTHGNGDACIVLDVPAFENDPVGYLENLIQPVAPEPAEEDDED